MKMVECLGNKKASSGVMPLSLCSYAIPKSEVDDSQYNFVAGMAGAIDVYLNNDLMDYQIAGPEKVLSENTWTCGTTIARNISNVANRLSKRLRINRSQKEIVII